MERSSQDQVLIEVSADPDTIHLYWHDLLYILNNFIVRTLYSTIIPQAVFSLEGWGMWFSQGRAISTG